MTHRSHDPQRGSAMILVVTIIAALTAGAGVMVYLQLQSTRSAALVVGGRGALYCAEAGLATARDIFGANAASWNAMIDADPANDPTWYPLTGDIDGDNQSDYTVTLRDNDDELPPLDNDPAKDNDSRVFIVSTCTKYPNTPRTILELVTYQSGGIAYRNQSGGGAGNTGNNN